MVLQCISLATLEDRYHRIWLIVGVSENMCNKNEKGLMLSLDQASQWIQVLLLTCSDEINNI